MNMSLVNMPDDMTPEGDAPAGWQLKKMTERHRSVCALLAQGLPQTTVAAMCGITPVYVGMLLRQPLCMAYIKELSTVAGVQLESLFPKAVEVIGDIMLTGNAAEKLKAIRVHGELTKRLGSGGLPPQDNPSVDRLDRLADRLITLLAQGKQRSIENAEVEEGQFTILQGSSEVLQAGRPRGQPAQEDGAGSGAGIGREEG